MQLCVSRAHLQEFLYSPNATGAAKTVNAGDTIYPRHQAPSSTRAGSQDVGEIIAVIGVGFMIVSLGSLMIWWMSRHQGIWAKTFALLMTMFAWLVTYIAAASLINND